MRKISPNDVKLDFIRKIDELGEFHDSGFCLFSNEKDQSTLIEHSLLAAAVIWEGFVSDIFIAFINNDATQFKVHLEESFETYLDKQPKSKQVFDTFGALTFPKHLKKADVLALADSMGNNITFPNFDRLEQKARTWLVAAHAAKFSGLTPSQKAVVNSVIALRNHIAHRSQRSLDAMNDVLAHGALHPTGVRRINNRFHNVGAWLKSVPVGKKQMRFSIIVEELRSIGQTF